MVMVVGFRVRVMVVGLGGIGGDGGGVGWVGGWIGGASICPSGWEFNAKEAQIRLSESAKVGWCWYLCQGWWPGGRVGAACMCGWSSLQTRRCCFVSYGGLFVGLFCSLSLAPG